MTRVPVRLAALCASFSALTLLSGCAMQSTAPSPVTPKGISLSGSVHGGQQPVAGAHIFLFQANTAGYGAPSIDLLHDFGAATGLPTDPLQSDAYYLTSGADGSFSLTGDYFCNNSTAPNNPVYLLATQGNPGLPAGSSNPALAELAVLGPCPSGDQFSSTLYISVNELTTAAGVYSLAGFLSAPSALSIPATQLAQTGIANAAANGMSLVTLANGTANPLTAAGGTVDTAKLNLLADIAAACVNSDGTGTGCNTLFRYATTDGTSTGAQPADTVTALLNIAHHPAANVGNLAALAVPTAPYQPATAAPNDLTLTVAFAAPGTGYPVNPAVDAAGNVWFPYFATGATGEIGGVFSLSPLGVPGGNTVVSSSAVPLQTAIDPSGNVWAGLTNSSQVVEVTPNGTLPGSVTTYTYDTQYSNDAAPQIAIDNAGTVYLSDVTRSTLYKLSRGTPTNLGTSSIDIALGNSGELLTFANNNGGFAEVLSPALSELGTCSSARCGLDSPGAIASDAFDTAWYLNSNSTLSALAGANTGVLSPLAGSPFSGGGLQTYNPFSGQVTPVLDGAGTVWIANYSADGSGSGTGSLSAFSNTGQPLSPATGYQPQGTCPALGTAVDGSGDVWISCRSTTTPVIEFLGAAAPVATPILPGHIGQRP